MTRILLGYDRFQLPTAIVNNGKEIFVVQKEKFQNSARVRVYSVIVSLLTEDDFERLYEIKSSSHMMKEFNEIAKRNEMYAGSESGTRTELIKSDLNTEIVDDLELAFKHLSKMKV